MLGGRGLCDVVLLVAVSGLDSGRLMGNVSVLVVFEDLAYFVAVAVK